MGIAELVPDMWKELERRKEEITELARRIVTVKEGSVRISDFLGITSMVGRHETEIAGLRQARLDISSPTLSRGPTESSRLPVPIYYGDRSTLPNFLKLFRTWTLAHDVENAIVTYESVRVVGKDWDELDNAHERENVNQFIDVWTALVKGIERDKTLLDMIITAGSPFEAWTVLFSMVGDESSEAAQDRVKKEFEGLTFRAGKESITDYVARAKALVLKLEQHGVTTSGQEINRRILNGLPSDFDVEKKTFLMVADIKFDELGEALARIEDSRTRDESAGGTHALATGGKPRGNGQGHGGGTRGGHGGRGGGGRGQHDGRGHQHHQQQWASQPPAQTSSAAVGFTAPRAASSAAVGLTVPHAASAAAATEASAATVRKAPWRVGIIACLFPLRPAGTLLCEVSSDIPRAAEHVSPSASVHCPAGRSTCQFLFEFSWRLRVFFGKRLRTATTTVDALAAGPAWTAGTLRLVLELLDRPGCDDPVLSPRQLCVFEWYSVQ